MSGIPVYTRGDTTASKPSGAKPQTAAPGSHKDSSLRPNPVAASKTTSPSSSSATTSTYPAARPGASAVPAPTGVPAPPPQQWQSNLQPTPVSHGETEGPPAPQPGAVPVPLSRKHVPPPPRAGEVYHPPQQTPGPPAAQSMPQPYPPQMSFAPPAPAFGGQPPAASTSMSNTASSGAFPASLPAPVGGYPRRSAEHEQHVPGYQQNVYASELTNNQRRGNEASNASSWENGGGTGSDSVWNTLGRMAQQAGAKIAEAEADVWRKINKE